MYNLPVDPAFVGDRRKWPAANVLKKMQTIDVWMPVSLSCDHRWLTTDKPDEKLVWLQICFDNESVIRKKRSLELMYCVYSTHVHRDGDCQTSAWLYPTTLNLVLFHDVPSPDSVRMTLCHWYLLHHQLTSSEVIHATTMSSSFPDRRLITMLLIWLKSHWHISCNGLLPRGRYCSIHALSTRWLCLRLNAAFR